MNVCRTVRLENGTVGQVVEERLLVQEIGDLVLVRLNDENGNKIFDFGKIVEILESNEPELPDPLGMRLGGTSYRE
jgi:hypothetical protein